MKNQELLVKKLQNELCDNDIYIEDIKLKLKNEISNSNNLSKEINILLQKNSSLSEYISESERIFKNEISKYKNEIAILNEKLELILKLENENDEKNKKNLKSYDNCKNELKIAHVSIINYQNDIEKKTCLINDLENENIRLSESISKFSEIKNNHFKDNKISLADEINIIKKDEELENINNYNACLLEEIVKIKKMNTYLDSEISRVNHENFKLKTHINTIKNSNNLLTDSSKYCCCVCF